MLLTLGIGSAASLAGCVITIICDEFPHWKRWIVVTAIGVIGFFCGLLYITPVSSSCSKRAVSTECHIYREV